MSSTPPKITAGGRSSRYRAVAIAVMACSLVGSACSSDDAPTASDTTVAAADEFPHAYELGRRVFEVAQFDVPADVQVCVGQEMLATFGSARAEDLVELRFRDQPPDEFARVARIFDRCIPGEAIAGALMNSAIGGVADITTAERVVDCVAGEIDGRVGVVIEEVERAQRIKESPEELLTTLDVCTPGPELNALIQTLLKSNGMAPPVAACLGKRLSDSYSFREVLEAVIAETTAGLEAGVLEILEECNNPPEEDPPGLPE